MKKTTLSALLGCLTISSLFLLGGCAGSKLGKPSIPDNQYNYRFHATLEPIMKDAARGNANAQYTLGYRYYYGIGVEENISLARYWFSEAAKNNQPMAAQALNDIEMWEAENQEDVTRRYVPKPAYLPPPPENRHKYADLLTGKPTKNNGDLTLQLFEGNSREQAEQFIAEHDLYGADITTETANNKTRYEVTYGAFSSMRKAQQAIKDLPEVVQNTKPSVRPMHSE